MTTHSDLVDFGVKWLKNRKFPIITKEIRAYGSVEQPDVIGFRESCSAVIECKVSRADFLKDQKKPFRQENGLGNYRFYLCPEGLVDIHELPDKWGLIYLCRDTLHDVHVPKGNIWPAYESNSAHTFLEFVQESNVHAERAVLYSIARRT